MSDDMREYTVSTQSDYLEKVSQARPISAISEIIWNGLDADAYNINVDIRKDILEPKIIIEDDGCGIDYADVEIRFAKLGGSLKKIKKVSPLGRYYHGKEGKGRFKAKSLGHVCNWYTTYKKNDKYYSYTISIIDTKVRVSAEKEVKTAKTGTRVEISELTKETIAIIEKNKNEDLTQEFTEIFAPYMKSYPDIKIYINSALLNVQDAIQKEQELDLTNIQTETEVYPVKLDVIEWKKSTKRQLFLCNKIGMQLDTVTDRKMPFGNFIFSAYIKSEYISYLDEQNILSISSDSDENLNKIIIEAINKLKGLYREKLAEDARSIVDTWKEEHSYPYTHQPKTRIEEATRQLFDIVAVNVSNNIPDFMNENTKNRTFQLRLLKEIVEKSPEDLQKIITEVLNLPSQQRKELADLLDSTSLVSLVSIAKEVTNRLHFINGLEELLFNDKFKNDFKERLQLQKLLEENTWFFGEEYHLVANDQSLTNVLKKYAKEQELDVLVDEPVQSYRNKKNDIIDLMISKANKRVNPREISNLVIELKSPKQPILTNKEFFQIQAYATAVAKDERFHNVKARWDFIVISNEMDEMVQDLASQKNRSGGLCFDKDNIKIWVKTWSEIIADNKERHKFLNDAVSDDLTKTRSLEYLRSTHEELLKDLIPAQQIEEEEINKE